MATDAQIAANRLNAQKSTGPRTDTGKHISRWNALQTGTYANELLIPGEHHEELNDLSAEYYDQKSPQTAEERFHVDSMIRCEWLIRRLTAAESNLWESGDSELIQADKFSCNGNIYKIHDRRLTRITRQIAQLHRMYRESATALAKLKSAPPVAPVVLRPAQNGEAAEPVAETNPICPTPALDETNPIPAPDLAIPITSAPPPDSAWQPAPPAWVQVRR